MKKFKDIDFESLLNETKTQTQNEEQKQKQK